MAKPSWWHRVIGVLRRPPVLAMATLVVVIGGAVLIGQHHAELDATESPRVAAAGSAAVERVAPAPAPERTRQDVPKADEHEPTVVPEVVAKTPNKQAVSRGKSDAPGQPVMIAKPEPVAHREAAVSTGHGAAGGDPLVEKSSITAGLATQDDAPVTQNLTEGTDLGALEQAPASKRASAKRPPGTSELFAQCRSAASRGDCVEVRTLARRIEQQNASFYRDRVAKDAAITSCLAGDAAK